MGRLILICSTWFLLILTRTAESKRCYRESVRTEIGPNPNLCNCGFFNCDCNCVKFSELSIECCLSDSNFVNCCRQWSGGAYSADPVPGISCNFTDDPNTVLDVSVDNNCYFGCCGTDSFSCSYPTSCSSTTSSYITVLTESDITSDSTLISTVTPVIVSITSVIINPSTSSSHPSTSSINPPASSTAIPSVSNNTSLPSSIVVPVVAGVLPAVCVLVVCAIGAITTLCIILSRRKAKHQIPINQQQPRTTDSLLRMDNVYYAVTETTRQPQENVNYSHIHSGELPHVQHPTTYSTLANAQTEAEGEAPPDYSMITLENTSPAAGAVYSTVVRIDGKKTTVTDRVNNDTTCDDPDYFEDPSLLQQIRANKQQ